MERISKRAFFTFVLLAFFLIVSSATDDTNNIPPSGTAESAQTNVVSTDDKTSADNVETKNGAEVKKPNATSESLEKKNCTADNQNDTECQQHEEENQSFVTKLLGKMKENSEMLKRTLYVLLGVTGIVVVYFVVRTVRLRRRRSKSRKYGVITTRGDLEMEPLGQGEDDDEDYTVFEMNGRTK